MVKKTKKRKKKTSPSLKKSVVASMMVKTAINILHGIDTALEKDEVYNDSFSKGYKMGLKKAKRIVKYNFALNDKP